MKTYKLKKEIKFPIERNPDKGLWGAFCQTDDLFVGRNAVFIKGSKIFEYCPELVNQYPNRLVSLKICDGGEGYTFEKDYSIIQNVGWLNGFAPRLYAETKVINGENKYNAQVVEFIEGDFPSKEGIAGELWNEYVKKFEKYYIRPTRGDMYSANFVDEKLVDFGCFEFKNKNKYRKELIKRFAQTAWWGRIKEKVSYQNIPIINMKGTRSYKRFEKLGMMDMDLTGKTVLDIGCSGGQTLYWATERGVDRIVGVDTPEVANVTFEMANFNNFFNIETVGCDLRNENIQEIIKGKTGIESFDYVVMFSVNHHIGFHKYMRDLCKDTLFLETNAAKMPEVEREEYPRKLKEIGFNEFEYRGQVDESGGRSLYICK